MFKDIETSKGTAQLKEISRDADGHRTFEVYHNGVLRGTCWSYTGNLSIRIPNERIVRKGKTRKLWAYKRSQEGRENGKWRDITVRDHVSRIDCITAVLP